MLHGVSYTVHDIHWMSCRRTMLLHPGIIHLPQHPCLGLRCPQNPCILIFMHIDFLYTLRSHFGTENLKQLFRKGDTCVSLGFHLLHTVPWSSDWVPSPTIPDAIHPSWNPQNTILACTSLFHCCLLFCLYCHLQVTVKWSCPGNSMSDKQSSLFWCCPLYSAYHSW